MTGPLSVGDDLCGTADSLAQLIRLKQSHHAA